MSCSVLFKRSLGAGAIASILFAGTLLDVRAAEGGFESGFTRVAREATPAVVFIRVEKEVTHSGMGSGQSPFGLFGDEFLDQFFRGRGGVPQQQQPRTHIERGQGSGFIISKDGYIVTNNHVVDDADTIKVKLKDGREYEAKRIGSDPRTEVALLKIDADGDLPVLAIGDSGALEIGEWVVAIGNPFGLSETLTVGVVSAKGRNNIGIADYEDFIQTDAAINPGNSGGPLLNIKGEVIGINTAIFSRSGGYMGIGFAVPINMAMKIKDQLLTDGHVTRGFLGVQLNPTEMDEHMAATFGLDEAGGVLVADVVEDSAADAAGLKAGDVLLKLDDKRVKDNGSFRNTIAMLPPGTRIVLTVFRDGKKMKVPVEIGNFPEDGETAGDSDALQRLGLSVQDLTQELAERLGYDSDEGVLVTEVREEGPAARRGIRPGVLLMAVNGAPVSNMQSLKKALETVRGDRVRLRVKTPEGHQLFVLVRMEPEE